MKFIMLFAASLVFASPVLAEDYEKGPNGGLMLDVAGIELLTSGNTVTINVWEACKPNPIPTKGYRMACVCHGIRPGGTGDSGDSPPFRHSPRNCPSRRAAVVRGIEPPARRAEAAGAEAHGRTLLRDAAPSEEQRRRPQEAVTRKCLI
ncbi:hypothetical protein H8A95_09245 [Bradyrhizobium sp. Pear76]|uniref:hypothetical protein n=1 Tax=Bradyrhizobium oropedii TaxID=1571201 RepID=UPI001E42C2E3|nr:hypothetical protein [Bradyrhizobium oropedii]MCC8962489.1 hypothetical protein [Bradyrhizobium oropedii]